jgi:lysozyme
MVREGVVLKAYQDEEGIWTIGCGHTSAIGPPAVKEGMVITQAQCDYFLNYDLGFTEAGVLRYIRAPMTQNQFDACVSFAYNVGFGLAGFQTSDLVKYINDGDMELAAANDFLNWEIPPSLQARRKDERLQFLTPNGDPFTAYAWEHP